MFESLLLELISTELTRQIHGCTYQKLYRAMKIITDDLYIGQYLLHTTHNVPYPYICIQIYCMKPCWKALTSECIIFYRKLQLSLIIDLGRQYIHN